MDSGVIVHHEAHEGTIDGKTNLDRISDKVSDDTLQNLRKSVLTKDRQTIPKQSFSVSRL